VVLANIVWDKLVWNPNSNGEYLVKSMCIPLLAPYYNNSCVSLCGLGKGLVPLKVEIVCWIAIINKINTRGVLNRKGIIERSTTIYLIFLVAEKFIDHF